MKETTFKLHARWIALFVVFLLVCAILNQIWPTCIEPFLSNRYNNHIFLGKDPKQMQLAYHVCHHSPNHKDNGYCNYYKDYFNKTQKSFDDTAKVLCNENKHLCSGNNFDRTNHHHLSAMYNFCSKIHDRDKRASDTLQNKCIGYVHNADLLMKWYNRTIQNNCKDDPEICQKYGIE